MKRFGGCSSLAIGAALLVGACDDSAAEIRNSGDDAGAPVREPEPSGASNEAGPAQSNVVDAGDSGPLEPGAAAPAVTADAGAGDVVLDATVEAAGDAMVGAPQGPEPRPGAAPTTAPSSGVAPGCGFEAPAFCETFDELAVGIGRAGDVAGERFSGSRLMPQLPTFDGAFPIAAATTPSCRSDLPERIEPPRDFLLCDANTGHASRHLLIVTAAQNYGQNSVRVRQPFDFDGRTGRIRVDAELWSPSLLYGFVSLAITEEPIGAPSFAIDQNYEGGALPPNGVSFQFTNSTCALEDSIALTSVIVTNDYEQAIVALTDGPCISTTSGELNPVEIQLSETEVTVLAGDASPEQGAALQQLGQVDVDLSFSRGYVQLNVHNHASLKYSEGEANPKDAWSARFDNLGFDGPSISPLREYEVPDSLEPVQVGDWSGVGIGHYVPTNPDAPLVLRFDDVDPADAERALLTFNGWFLPYGLVQPALLLRLNDGTVVERPFTAQEVNAITSPVGQGAVSLVVELPQDDLLSGANQLALWLRDVPTDYPPAIANVDLIIDTAAPGP